MYVPDTLGLNSGAPDGHVRTVEGSPGGLSPIGLEHWGAGLGPGAFTPTGLGPGDRAVILTAGYFKSESRL